MHQIIKKAFTLIELLVVITIIGILSGLIVVSMGGMTTKATIAKSQVFSNSLRNSLMMNLVSEWKFDGVGKNDGDTADTTYMQDNWSGNNCSINGTPKVKTGSNCINGSCLQFNGSTDYLDCGSNASLKPTKAVTMAFWLNPTAYSGYYNYTLIGFPQDCGYSFQEQPFTDGWGTIMELNPVSGRRFWDMVYPKWIPLNTWTYLVLVYDTEGGKFKAYKNGSLFNTVSITTGDITYSGNFQMGNIYTGLMDEVRIYNAVIPASQIKEQYYAGLNSLLANGNIISGEYSERINSIASK